MSGPNFRKTECFIPTCRTCGADLLEHEEMVPHCENPWLGPDDPEAEALRCPHCDPIPYAPVDRSPDGTERIGWPTGPVENGEIMVIRPGSPGYATVGSQRFTTEDVARWFGIPRELVEVSLEQIRLSDPTTLDVQVLALRRGDRTYVAPLGTPWPAFDELLGPAWTALEDVPVEQLAAMTIKERREQ